MVLPSFSHGGDGVAHCLPSTPDHVIHNLELRLGARLERVEMDPEPLAEKIDAAFGNAQPSSEFSRGDQPSKSSSKRDLLSLAQSDLLTTEGKGAVVRFVDDLLLAALRNSVSDLHLQPSGSSLMVRERIDGLLRTTSHIPIEYGAAVTSRVKVLGQMDIAERSIAQDGRATVRIGEGLVDLRVSTFPTKHGERTVVRLLDQRQSLGTLEGLGFPLEVLPSYLSQAKRPSGLILVTGPTGSGKTTTLYTTLAAIADPRKNVITIEDPIEYELSAQNEAISQSQTNSKKGHSFARGLRHMLRQDPDVILIGEIRDAETARIAIQASLTGHLVFSTLHTNDSAGAISRLVDLGLEPFLVASCLNCILAQRLIRQLHTECRGRGCEDCHQTGFLGRIGLFEFLECETSIQGLIQQNAGHREIWEAAKKNGVMTLLERGRQMVEGGITTEAELRRVLA